MEIEEKKPSKMRVLPYFLAGAALGAAAGVLLAPDSGKQTRRRVGGWIKDKSLKGKEAIVEGGRKLYKENVKELIGV